LFLLQRVGRLDVGAILAASWQPSLGYRRSVSVICKAAFRPCASAASTLL
jgi:hypothetical protein